MQSFEPRDDIALNCFGPATAEALVVEAAKSGDHSAFDELWARHSNTAFKLVYQIIGNRDDAEDILQDAWMKAFVHLKTFDLAHADCDQFCADGVAQEAFSSRDFDGLERRLRDLATMGSTRQQLKY